MYALSLEDNGEGAIGSNMQTIALSQTNAGVDLSSGSAMQNLELNTTTIHVSVIDTNGAPVANASVFANMTNGSTITSLYPGDPGETVIRAETGGTGVAVNAQGAVDLTTIEGVHFDAGNGDNRICAFVYQTTYCLSNALTVNSVTYATITVPAQTSTLSGKVTDVNGNAVSGVTVGITGVSGTGSVKTDAYGNYSISAPNGTYSLSINDTGEGAVGNMTQFSMIQNQPGIDLSGGNLSLNMQLTTTVIRVNVQDADGRPIANAQVYASSRDITETAHLYPGDSGEAVDHAQTGSVRVYTGTDGSANLTTFEGASYDAGSGTNEICAIVYGNTYCLSNAIIVSGTTNVVISTPYIMNTLSGTLTDSNGHPLSGIDIGISGLSGGGSATTNTSGQYSIGVPAGQYALSINDTGDGIVGNMADFSALQSAPGIDLSTGNISLNLLLETTVIHVTVKDGNGNLVPNAQVFAVTNRVTLPMHLYPGDLGETVNGAQTGSVRVYTSSNGTADLTTLDGASYDAGNGRNRICAIIYGQVTCLSAPVTVNDTTNVLIQPAVHPNAPTNLSAESPTNLLPQLQWDSTINPVDPTVSYSVYRNGAFAGSSPNTIFTDSTLDSDGPYNYYVVAVDSSGSMSAPSNTITVIYDTTAPTINYTFSPNSPNGSNGWYTSNVTITFTCNDSGSGVAGCSDPTTLSTDGTNQTVTGTATDNAGNSKSVTTSAVKIDKTAPAVSSAALGSANITYESHSSDSISADVSDATSGVAGGEYYIDTDPGNGNGTTLTPSSGHLTGSADLSTLSVGQHTLYIRSQDNAGNWSTSSAVQFTVAYPVPDAPTNLSAAASPTNQSPALTWTASSTATSYNVYRNGTKVGTSTTASFTDNGLSADGTYSYYVTAVNASGESSHSNTVSVVYDKMAPTITYTLSSQPNSYGWYNSSVTVTFHCDDNLSGVSSCPSPITVSTQGVNQSVGGTATDNAGNSASVTVSGINIDEAPPTTQAPSLSTTLVLISGQTVTVTSNVSDGLSGVVGGEYYITTSSTAPANAPGTGTHMTYNS
jgi:protocatechuate 3,4-dioxygenase beta subunit